MVLMLITKIEFKGREKHLRFFKILTVVENRRKSILPLDLKICVKKYYFPVA